jgi:transposase
VASESAAGWSPCRHVGFRRPGIRAPILPSCPSSLPPNADAVLLPRILVASSTAACSLHAIVTAADIQDRDGGAWLLGTLFGLYPFLLKLYADGGYQGPEFRKSVTAVLSQVQVEIVKRSDQAKGFIVLPKRWVVERTLAWLNRCRRLGKDWENLNHKARAFLLMASIRLMVRRLCRA